MNKDFLLVKQKFIENLLRRYSFWFYLTPHQLQTWTNKGIESKISLIAGVREPIVLSPLEHLTIMPLVFDYLDVTVSLRFGLSDEPFKTKLKILGDELGKDLISQLTVAIYEKLSKQKGDRFIYLMHNKPFALLSQDRLKPAPQPNIM